MSGDIIIGGFPCQVSSNDWSASSGGVKDASR